MKKYLKCNDSIRLIKRMVDKLRLPVYFYNYIISICGLLSRKVIVYSENNRAFNSVGRLFLSIGRLMFYFLVVYGAILTGASIFLKTDYSDLKYLWMAGLFLPFIFVYSMLFELADEKLFSLKITGKLAFKEYLYFFGSKYGKYRDIGIVGILILLLFTGSLIVLWNKGYLPPEVYPIALPMEFIAVCFLFASKYRKLEMDRLKDIDKVGSLVHLRSFHVFFILFLLILIISLSIVPNNKNYSNSLILGTLLLIALCVIIYLSWVWNVKWIRKSSNKKYFFERPIVREMLLQISICVVPFFMGVSSSLYLITNNYWAVSFAVFISTKVMSVLLLILVFGVILENMRYIGRYEDSYYYRVLKGEELQNKYKVSLNNFVLLIAISFLFVPILLVLSDFKEEFVFGFVLCVYMLIFLMITVLKPFGQMGFDGNPAISRYQRRYKKIILPLFTPVHILIGIKMVGFVLLLFGLRYGYLNSQKNYVYYNGNCFYSSIYGKNLTFIDNKFYDKFIVARYSGNYLKKINSFKEIEKSFVKTVNINGISDRDVLIDALRFSEVQRFLLPFYLEEAIHNVNSVAFYEKYFRTYISSCDNENSRLGISIFVISSFLAILLALVLSSFFVDGKRYNVSKKIFYGVFFQGLFLLIMTLLFLNMQYCILFFKGFPFYFLDNLLFLLGYQNYLTMSYTYISLAFLLLFLVVFQRYLEK